MEENKKEAIQRKIDDNNDRLNDLTSTKTLLVNTDMALFTAHIAVIAATWTKAMNDAQQIECYLKKVAKNIVSTSFLLALIKILVVAIGLPKSFN